MPFTCDQSVLQRFKIPTLANLSKLIVMGKKSKATTETRSKVALPPSPALDSTSKSVSRKKKASVPKPAVVAKSAPASAPIEDSDGDKDNDDPRSEYSSNDEDDETGGVDEKGMKHLLDLLGDDGLDEFGAAQLDALSGTNGAEAESSASGSGSESVSDDEDGADALSVDEETVSDEENEDEDELEDDDAGSNGAEDEDERLGSAANEEIALDEEDDVSVDEDAVPKQKVVINNKVSADRIYMSNLVRFHFNKQNEYAHNTF